MAHDETPLAVDERRLFPNSAATLHVPDRRSERSVVCVAFGLVDFNPAEARAMGLNSTPVLFVNGRRFAGSITWPNLKAIIEMEMDANKTYAAPAGENACCSVELKSPLSGK